jgi:hypothetical protein
MQPYCKSCFRNLPTEISACPSCAAHPPVSRLAAALAALGIAVVIAGMLTLRAPLCITGAVIGVVAVVVYCLPMM